MNCEQVSCLMHAYVDKELDVLATLDVESHLKSCDACRMKLENERRLSAMIGADASYFRAPDALRQRLSEISAIAAKDKPDRTETRPRFASWAIPRWLAAAAVLFLAVDIGFQVRQPSMQDRLADEAVSSHIRSLMANHLTDVASSDQHTVKPWFNGKLDFSPQVNDLSEQGFPLIGGRLDYLNSKPVTALVYRRRQHIINVFIWPEKDGRTLETYAATRNGYNLISLVSHGMNFWLVSDLNPKEIQELANFLRSH